MFETGAETYYKLTNGLVPISVSDIFQMEMHPYGPCDTDTSLVYRFNTLKYGKLSVRYESANIWNRPPAGVKCGPSLGMILRKVLKTWKAPLCRCGLGMLCVFNMLKV